MARCGRWFLPVVLALGAALVMGSAWRAGAHGSSGWQVLGLKNGQPTFLHPAGLAVGKGRVLFAVDSNNYRVIKLSAGGSVMSPLGSRGADVGQFGQDALGRGPESVAVDGAGNLYV